MFSLSNIRIGTKLAIMSGLGILLVAVMATCPAGLRTITLHAPSGIGFTETSATVEEIGKTFQSFHRMIETQAEEVATAFVDAWSDFDRPRAGRRASGARRR
jgi:hypothetical protein